MFDFLQNVLAGAAAAATMTDGAPVKASRPPPPRPTQPLDDETRPAPPQDVAKAVSHWADEDLPEPEPDLSPEPEPEPKKSAEDAKMDDVKARLGAAMQVGKDIADLPGLGEAVAKQRAELVTQELMRVPPERYQELLGQLPDDALAEVMRIQIEKKIELERALAAAKVMDEDASESLKDTNKAMLAGLLATMPPGMRSGVIDDLPEEEQGAAVAADERLDEQLAVEDAKYEKKQKKMAEGVADFEALAAAPAPEEKDPDWQKVQDKAADEALAKIPFNQRDEAMETMSPEARKTLEAAQAKKTKELEGKATALFNGINAGMLERGTDTATIRRTLAGLSASEVEELKLIYGKLHMEDGRPRDLEADLDEEFDDPSSLDRSFLRAVFTGDTAEQKAVALQLAAEGSGATDSTDEKLIMATLESIKDPEEREEVLRIFHQRQVDAGAEFTEVPAMLRDELLSGEAERDDYDYNRAMALVEGKFAQARAIEQDQALDPGIMGNFSTRMLTGGGALLMLGPIGAASVLLLGEAVDVSGVVDIDRPVAEPDTEKVAQLCEGCTKKELDETNEAFQETNHETLANVARRRCENQYDVNLVTYATAGDDVGVKASRWMKAASGDSADEQKMLSQVEGDTHLEVMERIEHDFGDGTFARVSKDVMNETEMKAQEELVSCGRVSPGLGLAAAADTGSFSWNLDDIQKHLIDPKTKKLYPKARMKEILEEFGEFTGVTTPEMLDDMIDDKLGGKDAFRMKQMLKGEPETLEEKFQRARELHEFDREGLGNVAGGAVTDSFSTAGSAEDAQFNRIAQLYGQLAPLEAKVQAGSATPEEQAEYAKTMNEFEERRGYLDSNSSSYQTSRDSITNDLTTIAATYAGVGLTVVSGGALSAPAAAALGAGLAGITTMAGKELLLGGGYNEHDFGKDLANTTLNIGTGVLTAGLAPGLDKFGSQIEGMVGGGLGKVLGGGAKGMIGSSLNGMLGSATGLLTDEKVLQGKGDLAGSAGKVALGGLGGAVGGLASGSLSKALDEIPGGILEAADPTSATWNIPGSAANKMISGTAGDLAGFAVDPGNQSDDFLDKFGKKIALGLPFGLGSALAEGFQARDTQETALERQGEREREGPDGYRPGGHVPDDWADDPGARARAADQVKADKKVAAAAQKLGLLDVDLNDPEVYREVESKARLAGLL